MPETRVVISRITSSERTDALVALALGIFVLGYQAAAGALPGSAWTIPILVLLSCGAIVVRRRRPFTASVAMTAGLVLVWASGQEQALTGATNVLLVVPPLLTYTLGTNAGLGTGLAGATLLAAGLQLGGPFNPLVEMITFGPLLAGRVVRSRRQLIEQIEIRNRELDTERAHFAQESVRYERARIARELHDIVGHSISVVVLQAAAAQRDASSGPDQTAGALDAIVEAAREALEEMGLLNRGPDPLHSGGLHRIDELTRRAAAHGLPVRYRPSGEPHALGATASDVAYRVVQESLTNAIKHAPGATIDIAVHERNNHIEIEVITEAPQAPPSGLERAGAGRGLSGMRERVAACGGTLTTGPTPSGGWSVAARLPKSTKQSEGASILTEEVMA
jgi:signal transduction histidine kinase